MERATTSHARMRGGRHQSGELGPGTYSSDDGLGINNGGFDGSGRFKLSTSKSMPAFSVTGSTRAAAQRARVCHAPCRRHQLAEPCVRFAPLAFARREFDGSGAQD